MIEPISSSHLHHEQESYAKTVFGFWLYLMSDCILFASLFATYAVLHKNTYAGPSSHDLYNLPFVLKETLILLSSSFTCGLGLYYARQQQKAKTLLFFALTFLLGVSFLTLEISEFVELAQAGNSWARSAFLSSYFALVGTHGLHITAGLLWILVLMLYVIVKGLTPSNLKKMMCLSLFWHFLDLVWIFIFTIVYLMGVIK